LVITLKIDSADAEGIFDVLEALPHNIKDKMKVKPERHGDSGVTAIILTIVAPLIYKTGEKIAEKVGETLAPHIARDTEKLYEYIREKIIQIIREKGYSVH
jgi:triphosphoribosyl-dephospho-CoA synthetase